MKIVKEIGIVLLLVIAIGGVLGVLFYEYRPSTKIVPIIEPYKVPNTIKEELDAIVKDIEQEKVEIVYEIDGTDLKNYEKSNDYQKGKVNPFSQASVSTPTNTIDTNNNNSNNNSNTNTNDNTNSNSVGSYLPNTGTK